MVLARGAVGGAFDFAFTNIAGFAVENARGQSSFGWEPLMLWMGSSKKASAPMVGSLISMLQRPERHGSRQSHVRPGA